MTRDEIKTAILEEIDNIAPGVASNGVDETADIRDALDLDSMDMLNLVAALHVRLHIEIPDADVSHLATLKGAIDYLGARMR